jgi:hypothetical protein
MVALAGVVALLAPLTHLPARLNRGWWIEALHIPQTAAAVGALGLAGLVLAMFLWWARGRTQASLEADVSMEPDGQTTSVEGLRRSNWRLARLGVLLMGLGMTLVCGQWLILHRVAPAGKIALAVQQSTEYYRAPMGAKSIKVMLPLRMTVVGAVFGDDPVVYVRFAPPKKENDAASQPLRPGESLDVAGLRFTFVGFTHAKSSLRATIKGTGPQTIEAAGSVGDVVRVSIDGPEFEILEIVPDYMQALGPAVELHSPDHEAFWLFARAAGHEGLDFGHGLELVDIQSVPAPVFAVAPPQPVWPLGTGGVLFVLGVVMFFAVPQRRLLTLVTEPGSPIHVSSLNEAGSLADEVAHRQAEVSP